MELEDLKADFPDVPDYITEELWDSGEFRALGSPWCVIFNNRGEHSAEGFTSKQGAIDALESNAYDRWERGTEEHVLHNGKDIGFIVSVKIQAQLFEEEV